MAAPSTAARVRRPISESASQASAVSAAVSVAAENPSRNTRRCPYRSPSLPSRGRATADSSIGPEITHAIVVSRSPNSCAIDPSEMVRMVIGKVEANMPASAAISTQRG